MTTVNLICQYPILTEAKMGPGPAWKKAVGFQSCSGFKGRARMLYMYCFPTFLISMITCHDISLLFTRPPVLREAQTWRVYVLLTFSFILFNDFCQTNYLNIYRTNLHQLCRHGRTTAVDERSEVSFSITQGTSSLQPILFANLPRSLSVKEF